MFKSKCDGRTGNNVFESVCSQFSLDIIEIWQNAVQLYNYPLKLKITKDRMTTQRIALKRSLSFWCIYQSGFIDRWCTMIVKKNPLICCRIQCLGKTPYSIAVSLNFTNLKKKYGKCYIGRKWRLEQNNIEPLDHISLLLWERKRYTLSALT